MASSSDPTELRIDGLKVTVSLCLCYTLCLFFVALWMRTKSRTYGMDDVIALVATILSMGQFATQYEALANGLGRTSEYLSASPQLDTLNQLQASRAGVILFFIALYCSKVSAIVLTSRFAQPGRHRITAYAILGPTALLGVVTVLELNISCGLTGQYYWRIVRNDPQCPNQYLRWQVSTAFDITTEILILALPIDFILSLQMSTSGKVKVLLRFWIRAPVLALAATRHYYISTLLSSSSALKADSVIIFQEIELAYSLSVLTLITIRPFTKDFNTGFGLGGDTVAHFGTSKAITDNSNSRSNNLSHSRSRFSANVSSNSHSGRMNGGLGSSRDKDGSKLEHKESEEYILQDQAAINSRRGSGQRIYKNVTYSVRTAERGSDLD